jgi:hypothetical protein
MSISVLLVSLLILCSVVLIYVEYQKYEYFETQATTTTTNTNIYSSIREPMMADISNIIHNDNMEHENNIKPILSNISNKIDLAKNAAENIKFPTEINFKEASPEQVQSMYASISPKLLSDIRKVVKKEILSDRTKPVLPNSNADNTNSTLQGKDYSSGCNDPTYIRKDSIPCWNCSLK